VPTGVTCGKFTE